MSINTNKLYESGQTNEINGPNLNEECEDKCGYLNEREFDD